MFKMLLLLSLCIMYMLLHIKGISIPPLISFCYVFVMLRIECLHKFRWQVGMRNFLYSFYFLHVYIDLTYYGQCMTNMGEVLYPPISLRADEKKRISLSDRTNCSQIRFTKFIWISVTKAKRTRHASLTKLRLANSQETDLAKFSK